ncbi:fimbrial protein [Hafnia alvei]|uniref:Pilin (Type 1 fimbria component protein) n=1 Tax=Hafnia alvei TaxID=569 RepID=A0A1C6YWB7_HAFAL|nr:type 1 fimbrial protein [Hafnia alvei]NLS56147.1 fimbrial protein [Hafnia alvei]SCM51075.1 Pilin (type 1 fimbria component protein) [Hafnia alvei]
MIKKMMFFYLLLTSSHAFSAAPEIVQIHYRGTVVIPPYTIATPFASVNFGNIIAADFASSSAATDWKELDINLTDCVGVTSFTISVSAPVSTANPAYIGSTGTAEHIGIEGAAILETDTPIYNGVVIARNTGGELSQTIPLKFRLHNDDSGEATTGTVSSTVTLTYAFQ